MTRRLVNPAQLAAPSGFTHALSATGTFVFLSGQTGMTRDGNIVEGGLVPQFRQALWNLLHALESAGGLPPDLAQLTVYLVDLAEYRERVGEIGQVWRDLAGRHFPTMAAVGVTRLWDLRAQVEIQGIAVLSAGPQ